MRAPLLFRRWIAALAGGLLACAAAATPAPLERDLGEGLVYVRVHRAPADLPGDAALHQRACVLDLRYAEADAAAAEVVASWLKFHATPKVPLLVLVNSGTSPHLQAALAARDALPGVLTIGLAGQKFSPDLPVPIAATDEEKAYHALEQGSTVAALTTDHPDKERNDEASLTHDHAGEDASGPARVPDRIELIDAVLQRAIHVHRALRALKKG